MKNLLVLGAIFLFTPFLYAEDSAECGLGVSLTISRGKPRATIAEKNYTVRENYTTISRVEERNATYEVRSDDEFLFTADNGTSVLLQYVFTGMSWCGEEDPLHPVRVRAYKLNGNEKELIQDLNCTCQNS